MSADGQASGPRKLAQAVGSAWSVRGMFPFGTLSLCFRCGLRPRRFWLRLYAASFVFVPLFRPLSPAC